MEEKQIISERLLSLRHKLGISQQKLADMLGVTRNWVSILEGDPEREASRTLLLRLSELEDDLAKATPLGGDPRRLMKQARERKGWTMRELSKESGYSVGVLQALEEGHGRGSQRQLEILEKILDLKPQELFQGSDSSITQENSLIATMGAKPQIILGPGIGTARYIPLISYAQAGKMGSYEDVYEYEGHLAFDVKDPKAFATTIRGDSMQPVYSEGDVLIIYPSFAARNGDLVMGKMDDSNGGDVMFKIYSSRDGGKNVLLSSYNPAYPPIEISKENMQWIYPVAAVTKMLRRS